MNPTIKKLERRVEELEKAIRAISEAANDPAKIHGPALDRAIRKAEKLVP